MTIQRARGGDRPSQAMLLRALQDRWFRVCRSLVRSDELALDATQETALRFLRDLPRFDGRSTLVTWSIGIAINVVREQRRHRSAPTRASPHYPSDPGAEHRPDEAAQRSEASQLIHSTLDELSDRQREVIVLRFFEQLSIEQTAAAMNCAPGTVKATLNQALRILRSRLRQLT